MTLLFAGTSRSSYIYQLTNYYMYGNSHDIQNLVRKYVKGCTLEYYAP